MNTYQISWADRLVLWFMHWPFTNFGLSLIPNVNMFDGLWSTGGFSLCRSATGSHQKCVNLSR